ncbi:Rho/RAC guanine nucleotide exchange factor, putative [Entamoeba histolytica HM-3:IMSS]|uniref:Rho/RAC guanine nucleotide exchange factor, putative n=1 Tax=Entamoeba histolytica HM-3:IMSS TaxID=885315 RepID=M7XB53_ENTHI|nr:Rho/RAC guanine nucleotide exchange factor, putative [Entamoeba histolytica HM-3:IMSS]
MSGSKRTENILKELVESEARYISQMELGLFKYKEPIEKDDKHIIGSEDLRKMFMYYQDIIEFNKQLLREFKDYLEKGELIKYVGTVFIANENHFNVYIKYFKASTKRQEVYGRIVNNLQQNFYLRSIQETEYKKGIQLQSLDSYLILPVQRLPRYQMLLIQLIQSIQMNSSPLQLITLINHQVRENDNTEQLTESSKRKTSKLFNKRRVSICVAPKFSIPSRASPASLSCQKLSRNISSQQLSSFSIIQPNQKEDNSSINQKEESLIEELTPIKVNNIKMDQSCQVGLFPQIEKPLLGRESSAPSLINRTRSNVCVELLQNEREIILQECHEAIQIITTKTNECNRAVVDEEQKIHDKNYRNEMNLKYQTEFNLPEKQFVAFEKVKWWLDDKALDGNFVLLTDSCFIESVTQTRIILYLEELQINVIKGGGQLELLYNDIDVIIGFTDETKWKKLILDQKIKHLEHKEERVGFFGTVMKLTGLLFE